MVYGVGCGAWGLKFGDWGLGFGVRWLPAASRQSDFVFRVWGFGFHDEGSTSGFQDWGLGFKGYLQRADGLAHVVLHDLLYLWL